MPILCGTISPDIAKIVKMSLSVFLTLVRLLN